MEEPTNTNAPAGDAGNNIENIMGTMAGGDQPNTKPGDNSGDAGKGQSAPDSGKGGEAQQPKWFSQLAEEIKNDTSKTEKLMKFEKLGDLANAYMELEGKLGNSLVKPGKDASDDEREAFYKALGKPDAADKYSIKGDDDGAKMFREMAYKNNLTDEQAKAIYAELENIGKNAMAQQQVYFQQQAKATQEALSAEYGKDYQTKIEMLKRGIKAYGGEAIGAKLQKAGLLGDLDVVKMFILLGEQSSEGGLPNRSQKNDDYKSIADGGHLSFGDIFDKKK